MDSGGNGQPVIYDVQYSDQRDRLTTFFRYFTVIPHSIVAGIWGVAVYVVTIGQWFVAVFTGKRSRGIWEFQRSWLAYSSRVNSYADLTHDSFPRFGPEWGSEPVAFDHRYVEPANRLTTALRFLWAIPAAIILAVIGIGAGVVIVICWFAIVFTGRMPRGMFDFVVRYERFALNVMAYQLLMSDTYPRWDGSGPVSTLPPGDHGSGGGPAGQVSSWSTPSGAPPSADPAWPGVPPTSSPPPPLRPGEPLPPPSGPPA